MVASVNLPPADSASAVVEANVRDRVQREGHARVIAELRLPGGGHRSEGELSDAGIAAQRHDIASARQQILGRLKGRAHRIVHQYDSVPLVALEVGPDALTELEAFPASVARVVEDTLNAPTLPDSVPLIGGTTAWTRGFDGSGTMVAILDTGVDRGHAFLSGKVVEEACYSSTSSGSTTFCPSGSSPQFGPGAAAPCPLSGCWHGTHVTGIAAGNGATAGVAFSGVAKGAQIMAVQVFSQFPPSECGGSAPCALAWTSDIIAGLERVYALRTTYTIASANLSLGGGTFTAPCDADPTKPIIDNLRSVGIATVIAAGNNGLVNALTAPGCISSAISVGATSKTDVVASFSNVAPFMSLFAPGVSIQSSIAGGGFGIASGTSMATPHVTGAWAVLKQAAPGATVDAILSAFQTTGVQIADTRAGGAVTKPRLRVDQALSVFVPTVSAVTPSTGSQGATVPVTIAGAGFATGAVVSFGAGITVGNVTLVSPTQLTASLAISPVATVGSRTVVVTNPGAQPAALANGFSVAQSSGGTSAINVAAQVNGGVASASSTASDLAAVNDGNRKGLTWWTDNTAGTYPDWVQITFNGAKSITEIDVVTVQDDWATPVDPTPTLTFSKYGITDFQVQYWTGSAWATVPGGTVAGNNLVLRRFSFAAITTDRIRVFITGASGWSRINEIEAWGTNASGASNTPPTVSITAPAAGATFTAPANITLTATAADTDGSVSKVEFFQGATKLGEALSGPYTITWSNVGVGAYSLTARATDNAGATTTSSAVSITVAAGGTGVLNVASQANGGVASASSTYSDLSAVNDGNRKGLTWWTDNTAGAYPDWVQIAFNGTKTITEIDVVTIQDDWATPVDPTPTLTFTKYGITDFQVQYWTGAAWATVPGGTVVGNNLVWRQFAFPAVTTDRIRVVVTGASGWSRINEIEAWGTAASGAPNTPPTVSITAPAAGATFTALANITLTAIAADSDGSVAKVEFFQGATKVGEALSAPYTVAWNNVGAGNYTLTAVATDNLGATTTSAAVPITVTGTGAAVVNVAAQVNGGVASASSTYSDLSAVNDGNRKGLTWWTDNTLYVFPDWVQITFNGTKTITEIDVVTVQDDWATPVDPTPTLAFTKWGITDFQVQYWTGAAWVTVPGGIVTANNLVWRQFKFAALTTDRIRVLVTGGPGWSRINEIEAWGN